MIHIVGKRNIPFIISCVLFVFAIGALALFGLKPGIDFKTGSLLEVQFRGSVPENSAVEAAIAPMNLGTVVLQKSGTDGLLIRMRDITPEEHEEILSRLRTTFAANTASTSTTGAAQHTPDVVEKQFQTIGPAVSSQLRTRAVQVIVAVMVLIVLFISYTFRRVSRPVASWKYGVVAILAMVHDVCITMGVFAVLGHYFGVEVDIPFVVALLTIFGYSVNDTIVVFDRVRENLIRRSATSFSDMVNVAVNETLSRSINTSMTSMLVMAALFFFGGPSIHYFSLALLIGIALGAYSSIFVACPLLVMWEQFQRRRAVKA